jgi:PIN domain nuclease of toxin-antitoxin system
MLALLYNEPGSATVAAALAAGAVISAVNLSEVVAKLRERGIPETAARTTTLALGITVVDFDSALAFAAGFLRPLTRAAGLSFGDRACLALAQQLGLAALTTDRSWNALVPGITVTVIR